MNAKKKNCDLIKNSFFDDIEESEEYEYPIWIKGNNLETLMKTYYYISVDKLVEGYLFKRCKDRDEPKKNYYVLYKDRLECYKVLFL